MATDVIMPQMGESIAEGTIVKWLKKVGDTVKRDEPLFEISTDKVDAEIPSPVAGVLVEILATEGQTVPINTVVGRIAAEGAQPVVAAPAVVAVAPPPPPPPPPPPVVVAPVAAPPASVTPVAAPVTTGKITEVIMPQMGESIAEGTIVKWIKKEGDTVKRDEALFEISTDKVDAEIPSPVAGVLTKILCSEGQTVAINTVVALIGDGSAAPAPAPTVPTSTVPTSTVATAAAAAPPPVAVTAAAPPSTTSGPLTVEELRQQRSSPLVRKIARENNVDLRQVAGTGLSGRVTKQDILGYIDNRPTAVGAAPSVVAPALPTIPVAITPTAPAVAPTAAPAVTAPAVASIPVFPAYQTGDRVEITPMTPIRRKTAEHMVASKRTSAHVTTLFEIDLTNVVKIRDKYKDKFLAEHGIKLTFMPFIMKSAIEALRLWPIVNASVDGDNIVYKKDINLGVAVALDWGLIVPVIKNAEEKNLVGLSRALNDLAGRARSKQLKPQEIQGGTFTITNPGMYGSLFGTPIINQPQVAIMGIGTIEKRLTVMPDDSIAIRTKAYFSLSFDHRIIDGAIADQFMAQVKKNMENFTAAEL